MVKERRLSGSIGNIKDNYRAGDCRRPFALPMGTLEGTSAYEIQMRYLELPTISVLANQAPKNKSVQLTYEVISEVHNKYNSMDSQQLWKDYSMAKCTSVIGHNQKDSA